MHIHIPTCTTILSLIIIDWYYNIKEVSTTLAYILFFPYPLYRFLHIYVMRKLRYFVYLYSWCEDKLKEKKQIFTISLIPYSNAWKIPVSRDEGNNF